MIKQDWEGKLLVALTADEIAIANLVGNARNFRAERLGRDPNYRGLNDKIEGMPQDELHRHGAGGEEATGKALGIYVSSFGQYYEEDEDVSGIQVRCRTKDGQELYVRPDETANVPWVLATGTLPAGLYTIHGWAMAEDIRKPRYWREAHPDFPRIACYVYPTHLLSQDWDKLIQWANDYRKYCIDRASNSVSPAASGVGSAYSGHAALRRVVP